MKTSIEEMYTMTKRWIRMACFGLLFAVPMAVTVFIFSYSSAQAQFTATSTEDCQICHAGFQEAWEEGSHGHSVSDPVFQEAWLEQGQPAMCMGCHTTGYDPDSATWDEDKINCVACHSPIPEDHPTEPMPADRSANFCGTCHTETYFEWQVSGHRKANLTCIGCHDPHETSLKSNDASMLCATCHRDRASNFAHSAHSSEGLTCADCHISPVEGASGEKGHAVRDHSFNVQLSTCNACHAYQMHDPVQVHPETESAQAEVGVTSTEMALISDDPGNVNPLGFATLAGLVGMAAGMILSPWLERWYQRFNGRKERGEDDA
jgi:hypothetical protein